LANGTDYTLQVRACNGESGYPEDVRCGPASDRATGRPFGGLAAPKVAVAPTDKWGRTIRADWTFPGGNGREVASQTVTITGTANDTPDASSLTGSWSRDVGYGATISVTARYCVGTGATQECKEATAKGSTASVFVVATQALAPLTGTCAVPEPYEGEWRTDANCAPGSWVPAPNPASLLCVRAGATYPEFPAGNPAPAPFKMVNQWYLGIDDNWYRKPVLAGPDPSIPTC
jgi:hypothetical protein